MGAKHENKIRVVATIFPFADWANQIGGQYVDVICLLPPGASPHTYEISTSDVKAVQQASLVICNGQGLDDWAGKMVEHSANKRLIKLALAPFLPLAPMPTTIAEDESHDRNEGEHHDHHDHASTGCGMWLDPMRAVRMVDAIAETLAKIDPSHRDYFQDRAKRYFAQLDRIDREYRRALNPAKGGVILLHEDFAYLFRRYNIEIYGIVEPYPGKEPSVEYIQKLTALAAGRPVQYILTEPQLSLKPAQVLADQLKVPMITVDPIGGYGIPDRDSYVGLMTYNLNQLKGKAAR